MSTTIPTQKDPIAALGIKSAGSSYGFSNGDLYTSILNGDFTKSAYKNKYVTELPKYGELPAISANTVLSGNDAVKEPGMFDGLLDSKMGSKFGEATGGLASLYGIYASMQGMGMAKEANKRAGEQFAAAQEEDAYRKVQRKNWGDGLALAVNKNSPTSIIK